MELRGVAGEAMKVVRPLAGTDHVLTLETPPVPVTVLGDADRIKTIISNLLENAIKYSPNGGRIKCVLSTADRIATLRVVDDGVGITLRISPGFSTGSSGSSTARPAMSAAPGSASTSRAS